MMFLADECCDGLLVDGLRKDGYDVSYVKEAAGKLDRLREILQAHSDRLPDHFVVVDPDKARLRPLN